MHKLLERQLKKCFVAGRPESEEFRRFLTAVDQAYTHSDDARSSVERSLELMSNELLERNEQLQADLLEIKRLGLELRQADKLRAVGQLAAGVAHEINTPIQFVSDSLSFLQEAASELGGVVALGRRLCVSLEQGKDALPTLADLKRLLQDVEGDYLLREIPLALERSLEGIARVSQIVVALKDFGRPDQRERAFSDLNRGLENTLIVIQSQVRDIADVELDLAELPEVPCYAGDINQVFLNLLINAAQAIEERFQDGSERGLIRVRSWIDDPSVCIEITDNGRGIPEADKPRIFEPFFTTKPVGKGSGQGLAIARSIVNDKHGGTISFASEFGNGASFRVELPLEAPLSGSATQSRVSARQGGARG